ncbi:MAG: hypothetical protein J6Y94_05565 [Bacteriovoracaceae bacterium]|nr:hypothetical protein [Bacteriovoracaceae bacterium]
MLKDTSRLISITLLWALVATAAWGQGPREETVWQDSKNDLKTVLYAGAGGMVLGLSTLSFAKRPSKKLRNITIGGALGVAAGVAFVIYSQAAKSRSALPQAELDSVPSAYFNSQEREQWHAADAPAMAGPILVAHQFSF